MSRPKHRCMYNGEERTLSDLAKQAGVTHDTMRGRLTRTAKQVEIDGVYFYVCTDYHLRPALPVGRKRVQPRSTTGFSVTRYSASADGDKAVMKMAAMSQAWLAKPIRTRELPDYGEEA